MPWTPTLDTYIGVGGFAGTMLGIWVSWLSLEEAKRAKLAAESAESAANAARDSVRREDRKAKLLTKLTQLLVETDGMWKADQNLVQAQFEPKQIQLRRELINCANAASGNFSEITEKLRQAAASLDDYEGARLGDDEDVVQRRKHLIQSIGHIISETHGVLELGNYDHG